MGPRKTRISMRGANAIRGALAWLVGIVALTLPALATPPNIIVDAQFIEPTSRYGHNVLGPDAEWGALKLRVDFCNDCGSSDLRDVVIRLPQSRVFEDLSPRIIDLDSDESPEIVVIESDASRGARLAVYDEAGLITATPFIGRSFRWLAPLGAADLDDDEVIELAFIDRPHLAKTLRVWRYEDQKLTQVDALPGLTNHRIGQAFISGGIRDCGQGPEIITADAHWRRVVATRLIDGKLRPGDIGAFSGLSALDDALACK